MHVQSSSVVQLNIEEVKKNLTDIFIQVHVYKQIMTLPINAERECLAFNLIGMKTIIIIHWRIGW